MKIIDVIRHWKVQAEDNGWKLMEMTLSLQDAATRLIALLLSVHRPSLTQILSAKASSSTGPSTNSEPSWSPS
jgi:hypothetical protein